MSVCSKLPVPEFIYCYNSDEVSLASSDSLLEESDDVQEHSNFSSTGDIPSHQNANIETIDNVLPQDKKESFPERNSYKRNHRGIPLNENFQRRKNHFTSSNRNRVDYHVRHHGCGNTSRYHNSNKHTRMNNHHHYDHNNRLEPSWHQRRPRRDHRLQNQNRHHPYRHHEQFDESRNVQRWNYCCRNNNPSHFRNPTNTRNSHFSPPNWARQSSPNGRWCGMGYPPRKFYYR